MKISINCLHTFIFGFGPSLFMDRPDRPVTVMKKIFFFIHIGLILILAHASVTAFYKGVFPERFFGEKNIQTQALSLSDKETLPKEKNHENLQRTPEAVIERNLFQVVKDGSVSSEKSSDSNELDDLDLEPTRLELALWGTITGPEDSLFAVIEDKKQRKQALYRQGDEVQGARIKKILRNGVILTLNGDDQLLEMEEESRSFDMVRERRVIQENFQSSAVDLRSPEDIPDQAILKQRHHVKLRPYFMEDTMKGVMLYGIHSASPFRTLGLRNGDIVTSVDEKEISGVENPEQLLDSLTKPGATAITFLRGGQEKNMVYTNDDGKYRVSSRNADQP